MVKYFIKYLKNSHLLLIIKINYIQSPGVGTYNLLETE